MLFLSKQDTYTASEYEIIHAFPTNTNKATKLLCGHGDSEKRTWHAGAHKQLCGHSCVSNSSSMLQTQIHLQTSSLQARYSHITEGPHRVRTQAVNPETQLEKLQE